MLAQHYSMYLSRIVACIVALVLVQALGSAAKAVHVQTDEQFVEALADESVIEIVLDNNIRFEPDTWGAVCKADTCHLTRNVTVSSSDDGPHKVLDFNARSVQNQLVIAPSVNLSFIHLTLKDTRYGAGADIDLLGPSPDGILYMKDTAKLQTSCAPVVESQIRFYQRDPSVPGVNDITFPKQLDWDGVIYRDNIHYQDFSTRMAVGENVADNGYVVHKNNTYKLSHRFVDKPCMDAKGAPACIKQKMDEEYLATYPETATTRPSPASTPGVKAGIAIGAVAAAAALVAGAVFLLLKKRRKSAAPEYVLPVAECGALGDTGTPAGKGVGPPVLAVKAKLGDTPTTSSESFRCSMESGRGMGHHPPAGSGGHSGVHGRNSVGSIFYFDTDSAYAVPSILSSNLSKEEAASIQLGVVVGVGSFGRVFRGWYQGQQVAVKVINHSRQQAEKVSNEIRLMLLFKHPNVVQARAYVTWGSAGASNYISSSNTFTPTGNGDDDGPLFLFPKASLRSQDRAEGVGRGSSGAGGGFRPSRAYGNRGDVETWIVQDFCNGRTLMDAVLAGDHGGFFLEEIPQMAVALQQLLGVAQGMEYLHGHNICHGDLKAENVLLHYSGSACTADSTACIDGAQQQPPDNPVELALQLTAKVADFGLSRVMLAGQTHMSTHSMGTITHQPPELMRTGRLSKPCDVFSFGVLMWEVIMGSLPWKGKMMGEVMSHVMLEGGRLRFRSCIPKAYVALAQACWAEDPGCRPAFSQVVSELQQLKGQVEQLQEEVDMAWRQVSSYWD